MAQTVVLGDIKIPALGYGTAQVKSYNVNRFTKQTELNNTHSYYTEVCIHALGLRQNKQQLSYRIILLNTQLF